MAKKMNDLTDPFDDSRWRNDCEDDSNDQLLQESHWQAQDLERLQDRLDRYVATMIASPSFEGAAHDTIMELALFAIKKVDEAAKREILGHD